MSDFKFSPDDKELLRSTWNEYQKVDEGFSVAIILRLIDIAPDLLDFFPFTKDGEHGGNNYDTLAGHVEKIKTLVGMAVGMLDQAEKLHAIITSLGRRHLKYGLAGREDALPAMGKAVIWMMGRSLENRWTPQVQRVWISFFRSLVMCMSNGMSQEVAEHATPGGEKEEEGAPTHASSSARASPHAASHSPRRADSFGKSSRMVAAPARGVSASGAMSVTFSDWSDLANIHSKAAGGGMDGGIEHRAPIALIPVGGVTGVPTPRVNNTDARGGGDEPHGFSISPVRTSVPAKGARLMSRMGIEDMLHPRREFQDCAEQASSATPMSSASMMSGSIAGSGHSGGGGRPAGRAGGMHLRRQKESSLTGSSLVGTSGPSTPIIGMGSSGGTKQTPAHPNEVGVVTVRVRLSKSDIAAVRTTLARAVQGEGGRETVARMLFEGASEMSAGFEGAMFATYASLGEMGAADSAALELLEIVEVIVASLDAGPAKLSRVLLAQCDMYVRIARQRAHLEALRASWCTMLNKRLGKEHFTCEIAAVWHGVWDLIVTSLSSASAQSTGSLTLVGHGKGERDVVVGAKKARYLSRLPSNNTASLHSASLGTASTEMASWDAIPRHNPGGGGVMDGVSMSSASSSGVGGGGGGELSVEGRKERELLYRILPRKVAHALQEGRSVVPEDYDSVTIFFSDIVGFTNIAAELAPAQVMDLLERLYTRFDRVTAKHDLFKVETIGDSYMAVSGLPRRCENHVARVAGFSVDVVKAARKVVVNPQDPSMGRVTIRVGFHSGPVVASVVGRMNPRYCLFGDTVNTASRMESTSLPGMVHMSSLSAELLMESGEDFEVCSRGMMQVKGKGEMETFFLLHPDLPDPPDETPPEPMRGQSDSLTSLQIPSWMPSESAVGPATSTGYHLAEHLRRHFDSVQAGMKRSSSVPLALDLWPDKAVAAARGGGEGCEPDLLSLSLRNVRTGDAVGADSDLSAGGLGGAGYDGLDIPSSPSIAWTSGACLADDPTNMLLPGRRRTDWV